MWYFACPAAIGGWQYVVMSDTLVSGSASQPYDVRIAGPLPATSKYMDVFGLSAFWIPPAVNDNDAAEFIGTLKAQPYYLAPGMAGTFENQKLILSPKPGRRWAWRSVKRALPILSSQLD